MTKAAKRIVARKELCDHIPEGAFADSVFVWVGGYGGGLPWEEPVPREEFFGTPAPTLAEIMQELRSEPKASIVRCCCGSFVEAFTVTAQNERGTCAYCTYIEENPADAMLELWFELNGGKR